MANEFWFGVIRAVIKGPTNQVSIYWSAVGDTVHPQMFGNTNEISLLINHPKRLIYYRLPQLLDKKSWSAFGKTILPQKTERYGPMVNAYRLFFLCENTWQKTTRISVLALGEIPGM